MTNLIMLLPDWAPYAIVVGIFLLLLAAGAELVRVWLNHRRNARQHAGEDRGEGFGGLHNQDIA